MQIGQPTFRVALAPLDGSVEAERVLPWLRRLVGVRGEIHLLTVVRPARAVSTEIGTAYADQIETSDRLQALAALAARAGQLRADGARCQSHVRVGEPVTTILTMARDAGVDVIALTHCERRHGWRHWLWLSTGVAAQVQRRSAVPVLIARAGAVRSA